MKNRRSDYTEVELQEHFGYGVDGSTAQWAFEKGANNTTNYRKDKHDRFCKRCFSHNDGCVNTGTRHKDPNCNV